MDAATQESLSWAGEWEHSMDGTTAFGGGFTLRFYTGRQVRERTIDTLQPKVSGGLSASEEIIPPACPGFVCMR